MSRMSDAIVEIVESVLLSKEKMDDDAMFTELLDKLLMNPDEFWDEYKSAIPEKHYHLFTSEEEL